PAAGAVISSWSTLNSLPAGHDLDRAGEPPYRLRLTGHRLRMGCRGTGHHPACSTLAATAIGAAHPRRSPTSFVDPKPHTSDRG
ncbi:MAG TPA: hypothetical protein VIQ53_10855, partial [Inquilinus sp.]